MGWSQQDIVKYIELWDYRQRWGAINLEREDRQFLKKVESALPEIKSVKPSVKKPINEKSYYRRIQYFLDSMNSAEASLSTPEGSRGLWPILMEEELRTLNYYQPVLGLPDTLKAKVLNTFREEIVSSANKLYEGTIQFSNFNFSSLLIEPSDVVDKNWKPLRDSNFDDDNSYPILDKKNVPAFRKDVRDKINLLIKTTFPSLLNSDKPDPADDWIPESNS